MKIYVFILLIFVGFSACSTTDEASPKLSGEINELIIGKWQLTEYLADPGDGSGKWQKVAKNQVSTITFGQNTIEQSENGTKQKGTFTFSEEGGRAGLNIKIDGSTNVFRWYIGTVTADNLQLSYGCIEACDGKYVAVK